MKFKALSILATAFFGAMIIACDDDLNSVGNTIQPGGDDISVGADTVTLVAETVSFKDSVYAQTVYGWLGEYIDPLLGKTKSDYMSELYCMENSSFKDKVQSIDSVIFRSEFSSFRGDSVSPMGVSIYEVTKNLKPFFFTSVNPANYTDNMSKRLGQTLFSIQDLPDTILSSTHIKTISTKLNLELGKRFYQQWLDKPDTFNHTDSLKKFFKGIYVTTTFGSGSLMNIEYTDIRIYYTYEGRNVADTEDSLRVAVFGMAVTPEIIQMNHVENSIPESLFKEKNKTYLKTPAGVYTRLKIPLKDIINNVGEDKLINAANFRMIGYTEEEEKSDLSRPSNLLLINEDSLKNFFFSRRPNPIDGKTNFIISRTASAGSGYNSYNFGNIASIINYYADYKNEIDTLRYLLIPVSVREGSTSGSVADVYNLMSPTSAVLKTDEDNMKMSIIYSKYNSSKK